VSRITVFIIGVVLAAASGVVRAQDPPDPAAVSPAEIQRLFDSYALVQAQQFLNIADDQYTKFLPRFMALQNARRQALQQRTRMLNELRRLLMPSDAASDDQIKAAMKQLQEIDDRGEAEMKKAQEAVDSTLDTRQQARFRVFEEQMERRKLELVTRARQANRGNNPNRPNNRGR
jgi:hypothetical protein